MGYIPEGYINQTYTFEIDEVYSVLKELSEGIIFTVTTIGLSQIYADGLSREIARTKGTVTYRLTNDSRRALIDQLRKGLDRYFSRV